MLMSHKHRFIFIHIYKTAGTSIMGQFAPYSRLIDRLAYEYRFSKRIYSRIINQMGWHDDGLKQFTGYHKHAMAHEVEKRLDSKTFNSYYKFAFVRNPFDLLVSLYFYILQSKSHVMHGTVSSMSFLEFLKWHLLQNPPHQIDFLMNPNRDRRLVDYIGRFETLIKDVNIIRENLKLEVAGVVEHRNPSIKRKRKDYEDYYDNEGRKLVLNYFQADFQMLGYEFCSFQKSMPLMQRP